MFFNFPGFEEGSMGGHRGPSKDVDTTKLYKVLGIEKSSTQDEVKKAYKKLAIKHHPDKGGDPETFKELAKAYEVLSDPEKRSTYDQYGEEGLEAGGGGGDAMDIFEMMFGGGGGRRRGKPRGEDLKHVLEVSLEDLYNGLNKKMAIHRDIVCKECQGKGAPADGIKECHECDGKGITVTIRRMGPMIQQMQSRCAACRGQGTSIDPAKRCKPCSGSGKAKERKVLEVHVDKGMTHGQTITFSGCADEQPDTITGDVVFVLSQKESKHFKRKGNDLFMEKHISLMEALGGYKFILTHMDKRKLFISSNAGQVIKPHSVLAVKEEGMPLQKNPFMKGNLYIQFTVDFPSTLKKEDLKELGKILGMPDECVEEKDVEFHYLEEIDPREAEQQRRNQQGEAYDEDEEGGGQGGRRVQCAQQ